MFRDCGTHNLCLSRKIPGPIEAQATQARQLHSILEDMNTASQPKTPQALLLTFELRVACFALTLTLFLKFHSMKKVPIGGIQITQSLLGTAFGHFVHPRNLGQLETVHLAMQVYSSRHV